MESQAYPTGQTEQIIDIDTREISHPDKKTHQQPSGREHDQDGITGDDLGNPRLRQVGYSLGRKVSLPDLFHGETDWPSAKKRRSSSPAKMERVTFGRELEGVPRSHDGQIVYMPLWPAGPGLVSSVNLGGDWIRRRVESPPAGVGVSQPPMEISGQKLVSFHDFCRSRPRASRPTRRSTWLDNFTIFTNPCLVNCLRTRHQLWRDRLSGPSQAC